MLATIAIILVIYLLLGLTMHMQKSGDGELDGIAPVLRSLDTSV